MNGRAVPDAPEFTDDRRFADLWTFVAFAVEGRPELDRLTPPKRPEKKYAGRAVRRRPFSHPAAKS